MNNTISKSKSIIVTLALVLLMLVSFGAASQTRMITGVVSDQSWYLPGATVSIKGSEKMVSTDMEGNYIIEASIGDVLQFSYAGYRTQEIPVSSSGTVNVTLNELTSQLLSICTGPPRKLQINGIVTDGQKPLPNTIVELKRHGEITRCDINGKYELQKAIQGYTLVFSSKGFTSQEVLITKSQELNIKLTKKRTFIGRIFRHIGNL